MSGNDEDQNIINGEIPKLSRHHYKKQGTNSVSYTHLKLPTILRV